VHRFVRTLYPGPLLRINTSLSSVHSQENGTYAKITLVVCELWHTVFATSPGHRNGTL